MCKKMKQSTLILLLNGVTILALFFMVFCLVCYSRITTKLNTANKYRYELTYKSRGMMIREEHNLPLTAEGYEHLKTKIDGICIEKTRYMIPLSDSLTIELDIFSGKLSGLQIAEVEFADAMSAEHFTPPDWFGEDVTFCPQYHNSALSQMKLL